MALITKSTRNAARCGRALRRVPPWFFVASLGVWMGCAQNPTPPASTTAASSATATSAEPAGESGISAASPNAPEKVTLKTADGWTILGDRYVPQGTWRGAVVLLHQRGGSAADWTPLCQALQKAGFTALAIDQRGAGRSLKGPGPTGNNAPWDTSGDIAAAVASLKGRGGIGLVGASYGANNALIYAAAHPQQIKGVALFSPGANYHGLDALTPARSYRGPLLIFHAKGDTIADDGPQQIVAASASKDHTLRVLDGNGHGTALLNAAVEKEVVRFSTRVLKTG